MTDDVCESWEDVDVDKIVFKASKTKTKKPTYSSILSANTSNNSSNYFEVANSNNNGKDTKIVDNFNQATLNSNSNGCIRIMQRTSDRNELPRMILDNNRENIAKGLRILNRPNKNNALKNETKLKENEIQMQLKKSFEEKKAEYDKARLRIFGENMPNEDLMLNVTNSLDSINFSEKFNTTNTTKTNFIRTIVDNETNGRNLVTIIRQPIAPDGTRGFRARPSTNK